MRRNQEARPRVLAGLASCLTLGLAVALSFGGVAVADAAGNEEKLPEVPSPPPNVPNYGTTTKADGTPVAVVVSGGSGGKLNVVNLNTGEATNKDFSGWGTDAQPWGFATLNDRSVLIGAGKELYRYYPDGDTVEELSKEGVKGYDQVAGKADFIWDIAVDENGTAYIATQVDPQRGTGGNVLTWNQADGWGTLKGGDPVEEKQQHARSVAYDDGKVYVTVGADAPKVYRIDPKTGAKDVLPLPERVFRGKDLMHQLEVKAGKAYVGFRDGSGTAVLDLASGSTTLWDDVTSNVITRPGEAKKVYYWSKPKEQIARLVEYDPDTDTHTSLFTYDMLLRRLSPNSWATHDKFVSAEMNGGRLTTYDASTNASNLIEGKLTSSSRAIQSMTAADNGKLFASWYMASNKLLSITPGEKADDTTFSLLESPVGQGEGLATNGDTLVAGLYPDGKVTSRSTENDASCETEPKAVGKDQDRPYAITHTEGNMFAIGTVPKDGQLGGALAFYDAGACDFRKDAQGNNLVYTFNGLSYAEGVPQDRLAQQSPISMAYRDGKLYIGTTVRGGHTSRATDAQGEQLQEAQLVEFDVASGTVTRVINPLEGEKQNAITALTFGDDGQLYGITGNYVFTVNTSTFEVTKKNHVVSQGGDINRSWLVQRNGTLFAVLQGGLYAIQASDLAATPIATSDKGGVSALALGKDGYLYYARGADIYRNDYAKAGR